MLHGKLDLINRVIPFADAQAHCDIPCKIYDPAPALIAALSVIRLIDIINETRDQGDSSSVEYDNTITRCVQRKEEESEKLKHEIRVIWGDYFKSPQCEAFPEIHDLTHQIMIVASTCKQNVNRDDGEQLLELVNQFAEIFWSTKDIQSDRKISPYPPNLAVVYPQL